MVVDFNGNNQINSLHDVLKILEDTRDQPFVERFVALGFNPKIDFAGGDWRGCDFQHSDLRGSDFRNSRLFFADFSHANIRGTDFRGAGDVHKAKLHLALDWQEAVLEDYQRVLVQKEAQQSTLGFGTNIATSMNEKDWFYAVKACQKYDEAKEVLTLMEQAGFDLNPFAYSFVLDKAKRDSSLTKGSSRDHGWKLYQSFLQRGGIPDEVLSTAAMGVAPDIKQANDIFTQMEIDLKITDSLPGERAFNMVISRQESFSVALSIFHNMKKKNVRITRYTIFAMFDTCHDFAHAVTVLMEARKAGVGINDGEFVTELKNKTRYPGTAEWNISQGEAKGHSPHQIIHDLIKGILQEPFRSEALSILKLEV